MPFQLLNSSDTVLSSRSHPGLHLFGYRHLGQIVGLFATPADADTISHIIGNAVIRVSTPTDVHLAHQVIDASPHAPKGRVTGGAADVSELVCIGSAWRATELAEVVNDQPQLSGSATDYGTTGTTNLATKRLDFHVPIIVFVQPPCAAVDVIFPDTNLRPFGKAADCFK